MEKLLDKWLDGKIPKAVTLLMVREMERIYETLKHGQRASFTVLDKVRYQRKRRRGWVCC